MRKILSILCAVVFTLFALSACTPANNTGEAKNRLEQIKERGYIEVATEPYFAPNEFIDPTKTGDDKYVGSDIEFAKLIAERLGVELRIIPLEFSAVLSSITEGKYDIAISALAYTTERAENMELTDGYYFNPNSQGYSLLVREEDAGLYSSLDDFAGKKVVCQSGSIQEAFATSQMDVEALDELLRVSSTTDGYLMVSEGKADAAVCSVANAELYCEANPGLTTLKDAVKFESDPAFDGTRAGIPKGETELLEFVNEIIAELLESGQYVQWYDYYAEYARSLGIE